MDNKEFQKRVVEILKFLVGDLDNQVWHDTKIKIKELEELVSEDA